MNFDKYVLFFALGAIVGALIIVNSKLQTVVNHLEYLTFKDKYESANNR